MENKILPLFFAGIFLIVVFSVSASADTIFLDDFNDGNLNGWAITNNPSTLPGTQWTNSSNYAEAKPGNGTASPSNGTSVMTRTISTSNFQSIVVSYDRQLIGFDSEEEFKVSWFNGTNFITLEETLNSTPPNNGFEPKTFNLPSTANNNVNFSLKIECTSDAQADLCRVDNVKVEGTSTLQTSFLDNFCVFDNGVPDNPGNLKVSIKDVTVTEGFGNDEEWYPFDEIEVEVNVENKNTDDNIDNINIEWGLYDTENDDWVIEVDDVEEIDLKDGDDETLTFTITLDDSMDIDLEDLDDGSHYILFVRATGDVDNSNNDETCKSTSRDIELIIERDFVVLSNFELPESVSCGDTLTINADVWNVGTRDEDAVTVNVAVKDLKYTKLFEIGDINSFDSEGVEFTIPIPDDAQEKSYMINFEVYDEDKDIFENDNNDEAAFSRLFKVEGCGVSPPGEEDSNVVVSADLESGGKAGQSLSINTVITNTGNKDLILALNAAGYAQWANSVDLDRESLTLKAGESGNVKFVFDVKSDATGDQLFTIEVISGKEVVATQPVSVFIEGKSSGLSDLFGGNWYLWILGLVNLILVVLIIVVAVRVTRRKK